MICLKCEVEAIENVANNNKFYFCPSCREEVVPAQQIELDFPKDFEIPILEDYPEDLFDNWHNLSLSVFMSEGGK